MAGHQILIDTSMQGKVRWFNRHLGYGFIVSRESTLGEVFAHYSDIVGEGRRKLKPGDNVEFESEKTDNGLRAKSIKVLKDK